MDIRLSQPLLMDGATATNLLLRGMPQYSCPAEWMLENPEPVRQLHREFLQAGSRIICTPTTRANAVMLEEWNQQDRMEQYNERLAQMTVETCRSYDPQVLVAGVVAPLSTSMHIRRWPSNEVGLTC